MSEREVRIDEAIAAYYQAREKGAGLTRDELLARYPDLADDLAAFLDDVVTFERRAGAAEGATVGLDEAPPSVGQLPRDFGDYDLLAEIGRGAMGVVFKARQKSLDRLVALKMILSGQLASGDDVARFRREATAAANLDHPNILPVYEVGERDGQHYYSMKLAEAAVADRRDRFADPKAAARFVATAARAVHHAHQRGIIHRDVKPGNLLVDDQGEPHVTDFGLARRIEADARLTQSNAIVGTPSYMAPEQARADRHLTTAADVYGLGATLYDLLTSRPPFRAETPLDTVLAVLEGEPARPRSLNPGIDRDLETVCLKCLHKDPERRYASAAALADDLDRWARGEPILARPVTAGEKVAKWLRRRPAVAALSAALLLATVVGVVGVLTQWREAVAASRRESERAEGEEAARKDAEAAWESEAKRAREEEKARGEAERNQMLHLVGLARQAWSKNDLPQMLELLGQCPAGQRGWEWGYLKRLANMGLRTVASGSDFRSVAFSPDGKRLAVGGAGDGDDSSMRSVGGGNEVRIYDPTTGKELRRWVVEAAFVSRVAWSPDSRGLAVSSVLSAKGGTALSAVIDAFIPDKKATAGGQLRLYDADTGKLARDFGTPMAVPHAIAFRPDGKQLAVGGEDQVIRLLDVASGKQVRALTGHEATVRALAFHPDGAKLASAAGDWVTENQFKVWDLATGKATIQGDGSDSDGQAIAWSPDGKLLATGQGAKFVRLIDATDGRLVHTLTGHTDAVAAIAFSPDGLGLATASHDRSLRVWDVATGRARGVYRGHTTRLRDVAYSPDGRMLATCSVSPGGEVRLWDATRPEEEGVTVRGGEAVGGSEALEHTLRKKRLTAHSYQRPHFHPDGTRILTYQLPGVLLTSDSLTGQELSRCNVSPLIMGAAFHPKGTQAALVQWPGNAAGGDLGALLSTLQAPQAGLPSAVRAFLPDALLGGAMHLALLDPATGKAVVSVEEPSCLPGVPAFSADGSLVAAMTPVGVKVWDTRTGKVRHRVGDADAAPTTHLTISPDSRWLAVCHHMSKDILKESVRHDPPSQVVVFDLAKGREHRRWKPAGKQEGPLDFSPDGRLLLAPGGENEAQVLEVESGQVRHRLSGHRGVPVVGVFSPDGRLAATAGSDGEIRLWDVETGKLRHPLVGHSRTARHLAFHPGGRRLVSSSSAIYSMIEHQQDAGELLVWDVGTGKEVLRLEGSGQVVFSLDGHHLIGSGPDLRTRIWSAAGWTEADQERRRQAWEQERAGWHGRMQAIAKRAKNSSAEEFHLNRLIELEPAKPGHYTQRGRNRFVANLYRQAQADFGRAIALTPKPIKEGYWLRAMASLDLGEPDRALNDLDRAVRLDQRDPAIRYGRARAWVARKEWKRAVADLDVALAQEKKKPDWWAKRARALAELGRWKEADRDLASAMALDRSEMQLYEDRGLVCLARGDEAGYRKFTRAMLALYGPTSSASDAHDVAFAGALLPGALPAEDVVRLAARAMDPARKNPRNADFIDSEMHMQMGAAYFRAGLTAAAKKELLQAENLRGQETSALDALFLALCHHKLGEPDKAAAAYERGAALLAEAEKAGRLNWRQRLTRAAVKREVEEALEIDP